MSEGARLLVIENLLPEDGPSFAAMLDLEMLIYTAGGRERTDVQLRELLASAGLAPARTTPLHGSVHVLEARAAGHPSR
jgi:hypothetical protein